jgi:phosphoglycolate phosphatase
MHSTSRKTIMRLRAILFDKDGTLVDFHQTWGGATYAVMERLAAGDSGKLARLVDVNEFDLVERRIRPTSPLVAGSSADYGVLWAQALGVAPDQDFVDTMDALFVEEALARVAPIGTPEALFASLKSEGYLLGIVTNDSEAGAIAQCTKLGLMPWLDAVIGYDSGHGRKPEPGQLRAFARAHGIAPGETALVGDSLHDLHAARAAGVVSIAVLSGLAGEAELAAHADHVVADIMALPDLFRRLDAQA